MKKLFLIVFVLILNGCTKKPPSCADSDATDIIKQMIMKKIEERQASTPRLKEYFKETLINPDYEFSADFQLKDIRMTGKNSETGSFTCEAKILIDYTSVSGSPTKFYQNKQTWKINYITEITQDTGEPYISVYGLGTLY